jgi:hypothetical protein
MLPMALSPFLLKFYLAHLLAALILLNIAVGARDWSAPHWDSAYWRKKLVSNWSALAVQLMSA